MRHTFASPVSGPLHVSRTFVQVVLHGELFTPNGRIIHVVIQFDYAHVLVLRFLLALKDVDEEPGDCNHSECRQYGDEQWPATPARRISVVRICHSYFPRWMVSSFPRCLTPVKGRWRKSALPSGRRR